ncbi:MAG: DNA-binding response regulator [Subtercola sp.]|nr:DNA-binding response regulator [Subtercola sp.]
MNDRVRVAILSEHQMFADGLASWMAAFENRHVVVCAVRLPSALLDHPEFPVDVVVIDGDQRDLGQLAARVAAFVTPVTRVIVVGSSAHRAHSRIARAAGAYAYLAKTESAQELSHVIAGAALGAGFEPPPITASLMLGALQLHPALSPQEYRVMALVGDGLPVKQVASQLGLSQDTVRTYLKRIRAKHAAVGIELNSRIDFHRHAGGEPSAP